MIHILHVVTTMDYGGVETLLMELYRNIDRNQIQFDFLCHNTTEGKFCNEIEQLGGRIFAIKSVKRAGGSILYKKQLRKFLLSHPEFKIIHCHINTYNGYVLQTAKECHIPIRISHSHVSKHKLTAVRDYFQISSMKLINENATDYFACSKDAAEFIYNDERVIKNTVLFNNAIDTGKFQFSPDARAFIRKQFALYDKNVFIHIGRFTNEKNHRFAIDVFSEIVKEIPDSIFLLLGEGPLLPEIKNYADSLGLSDKVIFIGSKSNVSDYLSAADVFLLPSLFEGLGIAAIEAQCSGLPTFVSSGVPTEAKVTDMLQFIPLEDGAASWAKKIMPVLQNTHSIEYLDHRFEYSSVVKNSGYDIIDKAKWLQEFYFSRWREL